MSRIADYQRLSSATVIGLMSGTSADGVDAVKVRITGRKIEFVSSHSEPIPLQLRETLFCLFEDKATVREVARANVAVGELFAKAAIAAGAADLIGSHGQTVAHLPGEATLQIGEPAVIAARTKILTVGDFRPADLAEGGQAAPLVPFLDAWMLQSETTDRLVINLGGMANVTWIPRASDGVVLGWDTGPANVLMDALAERALGMPYDKNGALADEGQVLPELLQELLSNPYFARTGPKSTGREEFGREMVEMLWTRGKPADLMRTALALTAETVAGALSQVVTNDFEAVVGGGGAANPVLMRELTARLKARGCIALRPFDDFGIPAQAREAAAFALFAHLTVLGETSVLPSVTGASRAAVLGKICQPPI